MMKVPYSKTHKEIIHIIRRNYDIPAQGLVFLPIGDMSYSYKVKCTNGDYYYLKLLDKNIQKSAIERADIYLPFLHKLKEKRLFKHAIFPLTNKYNQYKTETSTIMLILFPWVDGHTLADAHPFSKDIVRKVARIAGKLHKSTPSIKETTNLPIEKFDLRFEEDLYHCINIMKSECNNHTYKKALANLILPKEKEIHTLFSQLKKLKNSFKFEEYELVVCHGDLWGGNMIQTIDELYFIDWETIILAPKEREMVGYANENFTEFVNSYKFENSFHKPVNIELIEFYSFQAQLRNLTNWMANILLRNVGDEQKGNDLEMIEFHCLNRWDGIKENLRRIEKSVDEV